MKIGIAGFIAGLGIVCAAVTPSAHHSFSAEFDANQPITVAGTVSKVEWTNPHARFSVAGKDSAGTAATYDFELGSSSSLLRRGWTRTTLKIGEAVTVEGYRARKAAHVANARTVTLSDGRKVLAGSSIEARP